MLAPLAADFSVMFGMKGQFVSFQQSRAAAEGSADNVKDETETDTDTSSDEERSGQCEAEPKNTEEKMKRRRLKRKRSERELAAEIEELQNELALSQREVEEASARVQETERNLRAEKIKQVMAKNQYCHFCE